MKREPGSVNYQRHHGGDRVLEPIDMERFDGARPFIIVCGLTGAKTILIKWYAYDVGDARKKFREWLAQPWQIITTDFAGNGLPNGFDFKTSQVYWFNIATE